MWQIINGFICSTITIIGVYIFGRIVLNKKPNLSKKQIIISMLITTIIHTTIYLNIVDTSKSLLMIILDIIFYKYLFRQSFKKTFIITLLYTIIMIATELFELFGTTKIIGISKNYYFNNYAGSIIGSIITIGLFIIITYIIKNLIRKILNSKVENDIKIIIIAILTILSIIMFFYTFIKEFKLTNNSIMYLITIFVLIFLLFGLIKQTIENNRLTKEYDKLLEFMTTYENEIEKQRVLRHETKNEFLAIKGKINDKENEKDIIEYIDDILKEKIEVKQEEYAKFGYLPANGIKGLCYLKIQDAKAKGISTSINISPRIKNSNIYKLNIKEQRNLGKILGVYLDNAIEAALDSKDKRIGIEAYLIKGKCQIIISNSYNKKIDINKIGKERYSTKGKNRGHGLLLVKHITSSNKLFDTNTTITDKLYTQKIMIKNLNSK